MLLCRYRKIWEYKRSSHHHLLWALCLALLLLPLWPADAYAAPAVAYSPETLLLSAPDLSQSGVAAAVVIEAHSGELIYSFNGDEPLPPASTTKIITALLALDLTPDLSVETVISSRAQAVEERSMHLRAGEIFTLSELLQGALIHSANDATYALAEAVAGSEPLFVRWMNQKATALGAYSANFYNTNGLPAEGHEISASDLARLTAYAYKNGFFAQTVAQKSVALGKGTSYRFYKNTNKLLWQDDHIVGVKTGTTDKAGSCLVAAYAQGASLFISVVFHSNDRYRQSLELLQYAAKAYRLLWPIEKGKALVYWPDTANGGELLYAADDLYLLRENKEKLDWRLVWNLPDSVSLLDADGSELGRVELVTKDQLAGFSSQNGET
jgi:D-alanyl-D-alanine carboxypeptidase